MHKILRWQARPLSGCPRLYTNNRHSHLFIYFQNRHLSSIDNEKTVQRRIDDLGGHEVAAGQYPRLPIRSDAFVSPETFTGEYQKKWEILQAGGKTPAEVTAYGRISSIRKQGRKLAFVTVNAGGLKTSVGDAAQIMLYVPSLASVSDLADEDAMAEGLKKTLGTIRRGDWISVSGLAERSNTGHFQLRAKTLPTFLAPALQAIPEAITDPEFRMRNRHADRIVDPSARDVIFLRHRLLSQLRSFLTDLDFVEVNTPLIGPSGGGAAARPFKTVATEFSDLTLNLRVAPELYLKRLIIGGMQRVYEVGPAFRNEGVDATHNPEFTIVEFYATMLNLADLMRMTESLFLSLANVAYEASRDFTSIPTPQFDFNGSLEKIEFIPMLEKEIGHKLGTAWEMPDLQNPEHAIDLLLQTFDSSGFPRPSNPTLPRVLDALAGHFLEPRCLSPTWIIHQPECMSPLAKSFDVRYASYDTSPSNPGAEGRSFRVSARAELFIHGREYVNCYEEENSPIEQRRKFQEQIDLHSGEDSFDDKEVDESYVRALEWGMPPTGGWGCGLDRLVMFFGGKSRIADVLPFGTLRNVVGLASGTMRKAQ